MEQESKRGPHDIEHEMETLPPPPMACDEDGSDAPPSMSIRGKGPMDQTIPDVTTGSTPVTRRDD